MNRRTKQRNVPIHVTLPHHLLEQLDHSLEYKQSRSKVIANLIATYLSDGGFVGEVYSSRRLMAILTQRDDVDETMKALMFQLLLKKGE